MNRIEETYPYRLTFIYCNGKCDLCRKDDGSQKSLCFCPPDHLTGWLLCDDCYTTYGEKLKNHWFMSYKDIIDKLGVNIRVQRSNGEIEDTWRVLENSTAQYYPDQDDFIVKCRKNCTDLLKGVRLKELIKLNC